MDEIVKVQNEIVETPADSVEPFRPEKELLVVDDLPHVPFKQLVNFVLQRVSLGEVISKIKSETEYVVQVPLKFKEAFEKGEVFIPRTKTRFNSDRSSLNITTKGNMSSSVLWT